MVGGPDRGHPAATRRTNQRCTVARDVNGPAKIGVTGVGGLGRHLARGIDASDDGEVVAVADVDEATLKAVGDELGLSEDARYADHVAMLDGVALDGVVIATPHALHYDQTVAAMERGIDVLCEKPLCIDLGDARDLVRRDESGDALLMVGYQRHLDPAFRTVRDALAERVGDPSFVTAEITQDWIDAQAGTWRADPDLSGGGQLYDTGSHLLDAVLWTTGLTPASVSAEMAFADDADRVDRHATLNVTFENGAVASVAVSGDVPRTREHLHVWGDRGACYVEGVEWDDREVTFVDGETGDERRPRLDRSGAREKTAVFAELVREGGGDPPATARDAYAVTALTEAAYEAARTGETVEIDRNV